MSDKLTFKEAGTMLKYAFKTVNKKVYLWTGLFGVVVGVLMGGAMLAGQATELDMKGEKVVHTSCSIIDKPLSYSTNGRSITSVSYGLRTSCGDFRSNESLDRTITLNETYNLTATVGNWANKPTVVSAEIVVK